MHLIYILYDINRNELKINYVITSYNAVLGLTKIKRMNINMNICYKIFFQWISNMNIIN